MKKIFFTALAGFVLLRAEIVDRVVASVNNIPITSYEVTKTFQQMHIPPKQALEYLINQKIIQSEIEKRGISVDDFDINNAMEKIAQQNGMTLFEFENILKQKHELKQFRKKIKMELLKQKLFSQVINSQLRVTPQEVKNFYKNNQNKFSIFKTIQVTEYMANNPELLKQIEKNPLINNPQIIQKTEVLNSNNLPLRFLFLFKNTKVGQFTPIINQGTYYATFYVENKSGKTVLPFDKVKNYVEEMLIQQKRNQILNDYFAKLRNQANIKIYNN